MSSSDEDGDREVNILDSGDEGLLNVLTQHDPIVDSLPPLDYSIGEPSSDPDVCEF